GIGGYFLSTNTEIFAQKTNKTSETSLVKEKLVELSEWTTLKYEYSNVIISRTDKTITLPFISDHHFTTFHVHEGIKIQTTPYFLYD
ncbi:MAG: hypothetical protein WCC74_03355, partial [Minisyncoccia bacterium]